MLLLRNGDILELNTVNPQLYLTLECIPKVSCMQQTLSYNRIALRKYLSKFIDEPIDRLLEKYMTDCSYVSIDKLVICKDNNTLMEKNFGYRVMTSFINWIRCHIVYRPFRLLGLSINQCFKLKSYYPTTSYHDLYHKLITYPAQIKKPKAFCHSSQKDRWHSHLSSSSILLICAARLHTTASYMHMN